MNEATDANSIDQLIAEIAAQAPTDATLTEVDGRWMLTMTRELPHPVERVWPKLTEPDELRKWSPVVPDRALTSLGPATARETPGADPVDAEVLVSDPPRELVHRWGGHLLRWTLTPIGSECRLTLAHTFDEAADRASFAAGWHICLAVLIAVIDGQGVERVVGGRANAYGWQALRDRYEAIFAGPHDASSLQDSHFPLDR